MRSTTPTEPFAIFVYLNMKNAFQTVLKYCTIMLPNGNPELFFFLMECIWNQPKKNKKQKQLIFLKAGELDSRSVKGLYLMGQALLELGSSRLNEAIASLKKGIFRKTG